jgi:predicted Zn-dependent protease
MYSGTRLRILQASVLVLSLAGALCAQDGRTRLKPGINSFSPQQDIELGRRAATEVEQVAQLCNDPKVDAYLTKLGMQLVEQLNTAV